jgi:hypothetical protein
VIDLSDVSCTVDFSSTVTPFDIDRAVADLAELREVKKALDEWETELSAWLTEALGYNTLTLDSGQSVEIKRGNDRKAWDHDELRRVVLARARDERIIDPETGEAEDLAEATLRVLTDCAHIDYWRKGALSERGLDVDEFCQTTAGRPRVVIT